MNNAARLLLLTLVYVLYICIGASVFMALEQPYERDLMREIRLSRERFIDSHSQCMSPEDLDGFALELERAIRFGVMYSTVRNATSSSDSLWDFGGSFFFTTTLVTTIGYGHTSPLTWSGQLFCLFFALFGIPLTFFFLGSVTYVVSKPSQKFLDYLVVKFDQRMPDLFIRGVHLGVLFVCVLGLFFLVPATIFSTVELGWSFFESFYFIFISLTTVGLGDFVPVTSISSDYKALYFVGVSVYLLLGLGMMLLLVDTIIKIPEIQRLWEMSSMSAPSSASTSLNSSRSASPTPSGGGDKSLLKTFGGKHKSEEERELTTAAAPIGTYDAIGVKEQRDA
ncbi:potassium channel subfamily K member 6-like [Diadema antillarum]|uniref:potassium channel subfamily K member 6-like n=1 Tax=Diadema antillarum TaxID=105358 RepID=UPI003A8C1657